MILKFKEIFYLLHNNTYELPFDILQYLDYTTISYQIVSSFACSRVCRIKSSPETDSFFLSVRR